VAEVTSRFTSTEAFVEMVESFGFKLGEEVRDFSIGGSVLMVGIAVDSFHPVLIHQDRRGASCAGTRAARLG